MRRASQRSAPKAPPGATVQIVVGDGLSARVIGAYAPKFVEKFTSLSEAKGWTAGRTLAVRHARVGLMNQVGELLKPQVVLLLIGDGVSTLLSEYQRKRLDPA